MEVAVAGVADGGDPGLRLVRDSTYGCQQVGDPRQGHSDVLDEQPTLLEQCGDRGTSRRHEHLSLGTVLGHRGEVGAVVDADALRGLDVQQAGRRVGLDDQQALHRRIQSHRPVSLDGTDRVPVHDLDR